MDITSAESITEAQRAVTVDIGRVDVLVNDPAVLLGENDDRRTFETNLFAVIEVCRALDREMGRAGYGRVVMTLAWRRSDAAFSSRL